MIVYLLWLHRCVSGRRPGDEARVKVSVETNEDVIGKALEDGLVPLMAEISPKRVNQYFI